MAESSSQATSQKKANWNTFNTGIFVELMHAEVIKGNRNDTTFTKAAWLSIQNVFNRRTSNSWDMRKFKNRLIVLKREWRTCDTLVNRTMGFGWDPVAQTITAKDEVWDGCIKANPKVAPFRGTHLENFEKLHVICAGTSTTGDLLRALNSGTRDPGSPMRNVGPSDDGEFVLSTEMDGNNDDPDDIEISEVPPPVRRRSEGSSSSSRRGKKASKVSLTEKLAESLCEYFDHKKEVALKNENYSLVECIKRLDQITAVTKGCSIWCRALKLFSTQYNRELFMTLELVDCYNWIKGELGLPELGLPTVV